MLDRVKERLTQFGYEPKEEDEAALTFCLDKVTCRIENNCNIVGIPEGLSYTAIDMTVGEFLMMKRTFAPGDLDSLDLDNAVKQIQTGDTNVVFFEGQSDSDKLNAFINYLTTAKKGQFSAYRKLRW